MLYQITNIEIMKKNLLFILLLILGYSTQTLGEIDPISGTIKLTGTSSDRNSISLSVRNGSLESVQSAKVRIISITGVLLGGGETDSKGFYSWKGTTGVPYFVEVSMIGYETVKGKCLGGYHYTVTFAGDGIVVKPTFAYSSMVNPLFQFLAVLDEKISIKESFA